MKEKVRQLYESRLKELKSLGFICKIGSQGAIEIIHNGFIVLYYPRREWFTGQSVRDGRGFNNMVAQMKGISKSNVDTFKGKKQRGYAIGKNDIADFWLIDKEEFRNKGKVFVPVIICKSIEEARMKITHYPHCCITKTVYIVDKEKIKIKFQQIVR